MVHKKGISDIVSTVLIILLVVIAVGIITTVVLRVTNRGGSEVQSYVSCQQLDIRPVKCTYVLNNGKYDATLLIQRKTGGANSNLTGLNALLDDSSGTNVTDITANAPAVLETKSYSINGLTKAPVKLGISAALRGTDGKEFPCLMPRKVDCTTTTAGAPPGPAAFDFTLTNGGTKSVSQGSPVTQTITATLSPDATTQQVTFSVLSGLPAGVTSSFDPTGCTPSCTTSLKLTTVLATPIGSSQITVNVTNGTISRTTQFSLEVVSSAT